VVTDTYRELPHPRPDLPSVRRALAIGAHPDDIEFGAGGTLARWAANGCEATMLVVTDGSKGSWDPATDRAALADTRRAEQANAAAVLGVTRVIHLDETDGELEYSMALRAELCRHIRLARPDVVFTHDPWQHYQIHPDHRVTGTAALDAVVAARDPLFFPEQELAAHRPAAVMLWSADEPDHWEDIAATFDLKVKALLCHRSQGTNSMGGADQDELRRQAFSDQVREWAAEQGKSGGLLLAESFKRVVP
jgi:LmbE family N-acetylglucosaminyl deacetylase